MHAGGDTRTISRILDQRTPSATVEVTSCAEVANCVALTARRCEWQSQTSPNHPSMVVLISWT